MDEARIKEILSSIEGVKVAVYGDFCLDAYWLLDPRGSEVSVETGLQARAVGRHHYSLGGASNVVANLAALQPALIQVIGVTGDDIFGRELLRQLHDLGVDTRHLVVQEEAFDTVTFGKPYLGDAEQARMDFGVFNRRSRETDEALLRGVREALDHVDALVVNQQVPGSIPDDRFIEEANRLFEQAGDKVVLLDSRHYGSRFRHVWRKTNDLEAARLNGVDAAPGDVLALADLAGYARTLHEQSGKPVFLTRGPRGIVTADAAGLHEVPGIQVLGKTDPVGAGDTVTSALALCLGGGVPPAEAAEFANLAAAVTVQKVFETGTAVGEEILAMGAEANYVYQPELAADLRSARYVEDTEIECTYASVPLGRVRHMVFDNDGTISTLRQGWEEIMAPVMVRAILGDAYESADETLYHKVRSRVVDYIDKSTGIQTILQMQALVEMVREFGIVPENRVLDKFGYKAIYNEALAELVTQRIGKLHRGELDIADYTIKGAPDLLAALRKRGVKLYLASGTDHDDVVAESRALGCFDLFGGGVYGALGDVSKYSKRMVIDRIVTENRLQGPELAVVGDGPVEIRECRKRGGLAVGVASDEIRRHGLNPEKRTRLVEAGAHLVVSDFSQRGKLLGLMLDA